MSETPNTTFQHDAVVYVAIPVNGVESVADIVGDIATYLDIVIGQAERAAALSRGVSAWGLSGDVTVYDSVADLAADVEEAAENAR